MEDFLVAAAAVVVPAVAQEVINRTVSSVLGKRKEKASQGDYMERLEAAVRRMHTVLQRTAKAPIADVSLLRDMIELKRVYMEARGVLNKHKKRQAHQDQQHQEEEEITQAITTTHSSSGGSPQAQGQGSVARRTIFSIASSFIGPMMKAEPSRLSCDDIERFERFAGSAQEFLGTVSRCASLWDRINYCSGPLVFHLFQRETLTHKTLEGSQQHSFTIWPIIIEGRGVEAMLWYTCTNHKRKISFQFKLLLRLSESTDIAQVAIKCLHSLAAKFKLGLLLDPATGALLQLATSQDIVSHAPQWRDPQRDSREEMCIKLTRLCRPNPLCCTAAYDYDEEPCAKESQIFPEEVISLYVRCSISGLELTLPSPSDDTMGVTVFGDQPPQLELSCSFMPHCVRHVMDSDLRKNVDSIMLEGQKEGVAFDIIAKAMQAAAEKAIEGLFRMNLEEFLATVFVGHVEHLFSEISFPMYYQESWSSEHGAAFFKVHDVDEHGRSRLTEEQWKMRKMRELEAKLRLLEEEGRLLRKKCLDVLGADEEEPPIRSKKEEPPAPNQGGSVRGQ